MPSLESTVPDRLGKRGRLRERRNPELAVEGPDALAVLAQRRGGLAGGREGGHQQSLSRLVEGIELKPTTCGALMAGSQLPSAARPRASRSSAPVSSRRCASSLASLPVVERLARTKGKSGHEFAPVERDRLVEKSEATRARLLDPVVVLADPAQGRSKLPEVNLQIVGTEADGLPIDGQSGPTQRSIQDRKRAPERPVRPRVVRLRPQQGGHGLAAGRPTCNREECEKGDRLAGVHDERYTVELHADWAQDLEGQTRSHGDTVQPRPQNRNDGDRAVRNDFRTPEV